MKLLIIFAITSSGVPEELKHFKKEATTYYLPASKLVSAQDGKWGLKFETCNILYPEERYIALGKCSDILRQLKDGK